MQNTKAGSIQIEQIKVGILVHNGKKTCSGKIPEPKKEVGRKKLTTKSGRTVTVNVKMPIKGLSTQPSRFKLPKFKPKDKDEPKNNKSNRNQVPKTSLPKYKWTSFLSGWVVSGLVMIE